MNAEATLPPIELLVWQGDYGLISMDSECLRIVSYMKFACVPVDIRFHKNPYWFQNGKLPIFKNGTFVADEYSAIVEHLRFVRFSLDFGLSTKSCSEMLALMSMVGRMLEPALEYVFWVDEVNFERLTRPWFSKVMPMFVNFLYIRKRRNRAVALMQALHPGEDDSKMLQKYIKTAAAECFAILSNRLGQLDFFYGTAPASLDCTVYAYLAPLMKIKFPSGAIPNLLDNYPNLTDYVKRIEDRYFPEIPTGPLVLQPDQNDKQEDSATPFGVKLFTFTFVACALLGYAISNNIVTIPKLPI